MNSLFQGAIIGLIGFLIFKSLKGPDTEEIEFIAFEDIPKRKGKVTIDSLRGVDENLLAIDRSTGTRLETTG